MKFLETFSKREKVTVILLLLAIVISPVILTQYSSLFSFTNTGQIGDTIGGITAPFVNLLAAFLVYKSFMVQYEANKQQKEEADKQRELLMRELTFNNLRYHIEIIDGRINRMNLVPLDDDWPPLNIADLYAKYLKGPRKLSQSHRSKINARLLISLSEYCQFCKTVEASTLSSYDKKLLMRDLYLKHFKGLLLRIQLNKTVPTAANGLLKLHELSKMIFKIIDKHEIRNDLIEPET